MDPIGERKLQRDRSAAVRSYSLRRIVDRLLAVLRPAKARRILKERQNDPISRSMSGLNGHEDSGPYRNNTPFKLGVYCGLLYLITASKNELAKMVQLREEMEMLLQNSREELRSKDALLKPLILSDTLASSITDTQEGSSSNSRHLSTQSQKPYVQPELESKMVPHHFLQDIISEQDECVEKVNELEAELEVELERLQLHLDRETALQHTQEGRIKDSRDVMSFDEIIDPLEASTELCIGVPPDEVERRLHELREARQQERIAELESALECARQKLIQKEVEVTRWKDTLLKCDDNQATKIVTQDVGSLLESFEVKTDFVSNGDTSTQTCVDTSLEYCPLEEEGRLFHYRHRRSSISSPLTLPHLKAVFKIQNGGSRIKF
ncbi:hypothetical protein L6164_024383 [Bauhinia variegata]|uniref:Uncharacterized protein n=1 Tax=Bauhinia variegata TaxID=167791 RepID=A0ACB9LZP2_BAUVA|nr:hypothetical protein L6164_024383 [Bauhinia variegata]